MIDIYNLLLEKQLSQKQFEHKCLLRYKLNQTKTLKTVPQ